MFCRKCGRELNEDTVFCPQCGTQVSETKKKYKESKGAIYIGGFVISCTYNSNCICN